MSLNNPSQRFVWKTYQVLLDQNPPVLNTLHEVFSGSEGVKLISVAIRQTNTPAGWEEVDILITQDGQAWLYDASVIGMLNDSIQYGISGYLFNVDEATFNLGLLSLAAADIPLLLNDNSSVKGATLEGKDIKLEVRQTSAIAAGARIMVKATYKKLEAVN